MLESGPSLWTWALAELPVTGVSVRAEELPPHRLEYLEFEGQVAQGRGSVTRLAAGHYEIQAQESDRLRLLLSSPELAGVLELTRNLPEKTAWTAVLTRTNQPPEPDSGAGQATGNARHLPRDVT
jgi:hypothetical protein